MDASRTVFHTCINYARHEEIKKTQEKYSYGQGKGCGLSQKTKRTTESLKRPNMKPILLPVTVKEYPIRFTPIAVKRCRLTKSHVDESCGICDLCFSLALGNGS